MNTLDVMKYGHAWLMKTIDRLPDADWATTGVCGVWSVKDIFAHLESYEQVLVDVLRSLLGHTSTPMLDDFVQQADTFNDRLVAGWAAQPPGAVLAAYVSAHQEAMRWAAQIPEARQRETGTLPWYGDEYALDDFVVYSFYGHKREHGAQINAFRDAIRR